MLSVVRQSFLLLEPRTRLLLIAISIARIFVNLIDIVAIALLASVSAVALDTLAIEDIPLIGSLVSASQDSFVILGLIGSGLLFLSKSGLAITMSWLTFKTLAGVEVVASRRVAQRFFLNGLMGFRGKSRANIEWTILRSTQIAFHQILGQAITFVSEVSLAVFVLALFFATDWLYATGVLLYFFTVLATFQYLTRNGVKAFGKKFSFASQKVGSTLQDLVSAYKELSVSNKLDSYLRQLDLHRTEAAKAQASMSFVSNLPRVVVELALIFGAILLALVFLNVDSSNTGVVTIGIFIVGSLRVMSSLLPIQRSLMVIRNLSPQARDAQMALGTISSMDSGNPQLTESSGNAALPGEENATTPEGGYSLKIKNVFFTYPDSRIAEPAVNGVTFEIQGGNFVAIVGPSGSGKTTICDLILGLHEPTAGDILISEMRPSSFRAQVDPLISYVPQRPGIVSGSIAQNIAIGTPDKEINEEAVWRALCASHLDSMVQDLPEGIHSDVGAQLDGFSGGQIQRLGLARALYRAPKLLVLDEATSALDLETENSIAEALSQFQGKMTLLVIAHRLSTVKNADTVIVMQKGRVEDSGKFHELAERSPILRKYVRLGRLD